jgi:hypothetical protein
MNPTATVDVVAREFRFEVGVVTLNGEDRFIDERGDVGPRRLILQIRPARFRRHPEATLGEIFVPAFQQRLELRAFDAVLRQFRFQLIAPRFERVGDVLQKEQAKDNVLVFRGVDLAAQSISGFHNVSAS